MAAADEFKLAVKNLFKRLRELEKAKTYFRTEIDRLKKDLHQPWSYNVARPNSPGMTGGDLTDERVVCEVTAVVDANTVTVKRKVSTAINSWSDNSDDTTTFNVGSVGHSLSVGDKVTVFWDGNNTSVTPATGIYHSLFGGGGGSTAKIFVVYANGVGDGIYDCHELGDSGGGTNVTNWHEYGLGLTGHRLPLASKMLSFKYGTTWYGIDAYSWGAAS